MWFSILGKNSWRALHGMNGLVAWCQETEQQGPMEGRCLSKPRLPWQMHTDWLLWTLDIYFNHSFGGWSNVPASLVFVKPWPGVIDVHIHTTVGRSSYSSLCPSGESLPFEHTYSGYFSKSHHCMLSPRSWGLTLRAGEGQHSLVYGTHGTT